MQGEKEFTFYSFIECEALKMCPFKNRNAFVSIWVWVVCILLILLKQTDALCQYKEEKKICAMLWYVHIWKY